MYRIQLEKLIRDYGSAYDFRHVVAEAKGLLAGEMDLEKARSILDEAERIGSANRTANARSHAAWYARREENAWAAMVGAARRQDRDEGGAAFTSDPQPSRVDRPWYEGLSTVIVTRHSGVVEWLAERGITGEVIEHVGPADVADKIVVGNLPLWLAAIAAGVGSIDLPGLRSEQRGRDLSPAEMDAADASIKWYRVQKVRGPFN